MRPITAILTRDLSGSGRRYIGGRLEEGGDRKIVTRNVQRAALREQSRNMLRRVVEVTERSRWEVVLMT